jgi:hypothetical protein
MQHAIVLVVWAVSAVAFGWLLWSSRRSSPFDSPEYQRQRRIAYLLSLLEVEAVSHVVSADGYEALMQELAGLLAAEGIEIATRWENA